MSLISAISSVVTDSDVRQIIVKVITHMEYCERTGDIVSRMGLIGISFRFNKIIGLMSEIINDIKKHRGCSFDERKAIIMNIKQQLIESHTLAYDFNYGICLHVAGLLGHFSLCTDTECTFCVDP